MKIYTKGGDQGSTSLIGGERVPKYDVRVEAYGSIDELSAQTAMLRDMLNGEDVTQFDDDLIVISRLLMHTELLMALGDGGKDKVNDLNGADFGFLEKRIDEISAVLPPIERFTLPGGHIVVSQAHICRTVCRRADRQACRAAAQYPVSSNALLFLNRLSDYLYVLGRRLAMLLGAEELLWEPRRTATNALFTGQTRNKPPGKYVTIRHKPKAKKISAH